MSVAVLGNLLTPQVINALNISNIPTTILLDEGDESIVSVPDFIATTMASTSRGVGR